MLIDIFIRRKTNLPIHHNPVTTIILLELNELLTH